MASIPAGGGGGITKPWVWMETSTGGQDWGEEQEKKVNKSEVYEDTLTKPVTS